MNSPLEHALTAAELGFRVLPLAPLGDAPLRAQDMATSDPAAVFDMFRAERQANYGIALDENLVAVVTETDSASLRWESLPLPATARISAKLTEGAMFIYRLSGTLEGALGTDLFPATRLVTSGHVVGPGSVLLPGGTVSGILKNIATITPDVLEALLAAPPPSNEELVDALNLLPEQTERGLRWLEDLVWGDPLGGLKELICRLRETTLSPDQQHLVAWNSRAGKEIRASEGGEAKLRALISSDQPAAPERRMELLADMERAALPSTWISRYSAWAASAAPQSPAAFHRVVAIAVMSWVFRDAQIHRRHDRTPIDLDAALAGANETARRDAVALGIHMAEQVDPLGAEPVLEIRLSGATGAPTSFPLALEADEPDATTSGAFEFPDGGLLLALELAAAKEKLLVAGQGDPWIVRVSDDASRRVEVIPETAKPFAEQIVCIAALVALSRCVAEIERQDVLVALDLSEAPLGALRWLSDR